MNRRILIANAGNPRIVTEALWGLKMHKNWVPEAIHIFTNRALPIAKGMGCFALLFCPRSRRPAG